MKIFKYCGPGIEPPVERLLTWAVYVSLDDAFCLFAVHVSIFWSPPPGKSSDILIVLVVNTLPIGPFNVLSPSQVTTPFFARPPAAKYLTLNCIGYD